MHSGAHEEDLSAMSAIQSLIVSPLSEKQVQPNSEIQDTRDQEPLADRTSEEMQDHQESQESSLSANQERNLLALAMSYLPSLPPEFLKAPRAGPPNSIFTLDILVRGHFLQQFTN